MPILRRALLVLLTLILPLQAQFGPEAEVKSKASLLAEASTIAPGSTFRVALHLEHPDGWHSYYKNSGGIEQSPEINWTLPDGFTAGQIQWPAPTVKEGDFGKSFIYAGSVTLLVDLTAPQTIEVGSTITLNANVAWQICEVGCIPEDASFELQLPVASSPVTNPANQALFEQARKKLPTTSDNWSFSADDSGNTVLIRFKSNKEFDQAPSDFIPDQQFVKSASAGGQITRDGDSILIRLPRATENAFGDPIEQGNAISGIVIGEKMSALMPLTSINATAKPPAEAKPASEATREAFSFAALLPILGGMFLGGLILNLMPCVFPVIGLKIMGFVQQAGSDRKKVILHGLTFTLGVIASFGVLSILLYTFKESFGWGDQLGEPWFVMPMMVLMFLLGLNMFGVFEIGVSATSVGGNLQSKSGLLGSFLSGALATLIATPCSAPFLGAAIGAAIALPAIQFFTAFGAMAIGLSTPYLVLSAFPKLIESLPRPGAWMESFKQAMSFLLFATAGFLLWVYTDLVAMQDMNWPFPIFGLTLIAVACWIHGRWNLPSRKRNTRVKALILIIIFAAGGFILTMPPAPADPTEHQAELTWEKWSPERVDRLVNEGTPVYIDFTAKWCATCRINKGRAYSQEVINLMNAKGVVALKADKTRPDPRIEVAIRQYGRAAIPVNVLLAPGKEPVILPELLSADDVIEALKILD